MAAPLTKAKVGTSISPSRRNTACPSSANWRMTARSLTSPIADRSAPTAKMNGLPVTAMAARSVIAATWSRAASSPESPPTPNVVGRVWSRSLSTVMSAMRPAPSGMSSSLTLEWVTTSSAALLVGVAHDWLPA